MTHSINSVHSANDAEKLASIFEKFPGIGPRQARRFVYFLLKSGSEYRSALERGVHDLAQSIHQCEQCKRYYATDGNTTCTLCTSAARNDAQLLIVEKDADLDVIEKSGAYSGRYFVLGGMVKLMDTSGNVPGGAKLLSYMKSMSNLDEIILAMPTTTEGEHTREAIEQLLGAVASGLGATITTLGRGLSTGAELEYADSATLKSALESRG